MAGNFWQSSH
uniref:Uncharacterized protein DKFZp459L1719 n=2 Tax=Bilateria TaxID=33213 RepID=Q5R696_PONAB